LTQDSRKEIEITRATYEQIAPTYAQVSAVMGENLTAFAEKFIHLLEPDAQILDVGCGPGRDMAWFESRNMHVTGVDYTQAMLEIARAKVHGSLVKADMRQMPFEAGSIDGIWCSASLLHLPKTDSPAALLEFKRVLKPDGILFLAVQEGEHLETREVYGENQHLFARYSMPEMTKMLEVAGFQIFEHDAHESRDRIWIRLLARVEKSDEQR
jgi:ubiquinone/menaquinone biosynthesis C-methylase UbiE